ncbi:N-acetyl-gamma-glutamyl-phosphate reductase [Thorsellia kenyensis]|uniref:N-acetyl-gamma-glutamyl-phosphate reductase n=1 Tax=Thorsellia kenyensis TaxID=1549888 RepID=A0ABV6CGI2_9GAMM
MVIIGASGYAGAELAFFLNKHPECDLVGLYVSANSADAGKSLSTLYPKFRGVLDKEIYPLNDIEKVAESCDVVFLATAHEVSHDIAPIFLQKGVCVFDLSGAFRVPSTEFYPTYYGFSHAYPEYLNKAVYGLAEFAQDALSQASLVAVPGCYPTASQLALKPLIEAGLLDLSMKPIINATSGVSGAGRKAALNTSFCEVSLQPYGVFTHRHQPEISYHLGTEVIFTPHLGQFERGILATVTCKVNEQASELRFREVFNKAYGHSKIVRLLDSGFPSLKSVVGLPYCDIGFAISDGYAIIVSAEDNLLKGAASQAVQCFNLRFGHEETLSLL